MTQDQIIFAVYQSILVGIISTVFAVISGSVKKTLQSLEKGIAENKEQTEIVKKDLADLKADLPFVYVLREDYIREQQNQEKQFNTLSTKLDRLLQKG